MASEKKNYVSDRALDKRIIHMQFGFIFHFISLPFYLASAANFIYKVLQNNGSQLLT